MKINFEYNNLVCLVCLRTCFFSAVSAEMLYRKNILYNMLVIENNKNSIYSVKENSSVT